MTAFYMFRLYFGIFWGTENKELHAHHTPHEAPLTMTLPLIVLTAITLVAGFIPFGHFVSASGEAYDIHLDWSVAITSIVVAVASIALATFIYAGERQPVANKMKAAFPNLHQWAYKRFYLDEVYQYVTHRIIFAKISKPIAWFDRHVVDGFFDFLATGTGKAEGSTFQAALANSWGQLQVLFEDDEIQSVYFMNPLDVADYLATANITLQTAFGMTYVENFLGLGTVIFNSSVPKGKIYATAKENLVLYYIPVNGADLNEAFDFTSDSTGLIGVHESPDYTNMTASDTVVSGIALFAERIDGVVVATIGSTGA